MLKRWIVVLLSLLTLNISYAATQKYYPITSFCVQNKFQYEENLKLNYIEIFNRKNRFRLFITMPYILYKGQIYYLNTSLRKGEQGQWYMSREYIETIREILKTGSKGRIIVESPEYTEQWMHDTQSQTSSKKTNSNNTIKISDKQQTKQQSTQETKQETKNIQKDPDQKTADKVQYIPVEGFVPLNAVIIDAGHGGKDPGAIGKSGIKEKEVVLNISRYLSQYLKADKDLNVFMTRSKDVYVSLENRTQYASQKAKKYNPLFVSIHGNMSLSRKSSGIEVFSLSDKASDDQALQVEMMENEGFHTQDIKKTDALFSIIADLVRDGLTKESSYLAEKLYNQLYTHTGAKKRGLKKANFFVLKYNTVPAVLVEVGFLSHPSEGSKLATQEYQKKVAKGLYYGIKKFVEQYNKTKGYSQ